MVCTCSAAKIGLMAILSYSSSLHQQKMIASRFVTAFPELRVGPFTIKDAKSSNFVVNLYSTEEEMQYIVQKCGWSVVRSLLDADLVL